MRWTINNSNHNSINTPILATSNTDKPKFTEYHYNIFYSILNDELTFPNGHLQESDLEDQKERITVEEMGNHPFLWDLIEKVEQTIEITDINTSTTVDNLIMKREQQTELIHPYGIIELTEKYLKSNGADNDKINPTIRSKIIFGVASILKQMHDKSVLFS